MIAHASESFFPRARVDLVLGAVALSLALAGCSASAKHGSAQLAAGGNGAAPAAAGASGVTATSSSLDASVPRTGASGGGAGVPASVGGAGTAAAGSGAAGMIGAAAGAGGAAGGAGTGGTAGSAATSGCDRTCLLQVLQKYLDALVAHDPSKAPISPMVKMTDNGMPAKPGDGLWKTASMLVADERLDYADPTTHNVGSQCVINEGASPALYEVRLKVDAGQVTEIESMTVRQQDAANGFFDPANLKPQPIFLQMPDPQKRMSRDALMTTQELYLDYLEGKKGGSEIPFDTNCARYENGVATASGLASFNLQSWGFMVTRRVLIIDEEAGITWGMFPFMQSDTALVVGEAFKMLDGKIMMIQAVMANMPSKAWD